MAPAVATAWGLVWIAVGRWAGQPDAPVVAFTAIALAVVVLAVAAGRLRARTASSAVTLSSPSL